MRGFGALLTDIRRANADIHPTTVSLARVCSASPIATRKQCAVSIRSIVRNIVHCSSAALPSASAGSVHRLFIQRGMLILQRRRVTFTVPIHWHHRLTARVKKTMEAVRLFSRPLVIPVMAVLPEGGRLGTTSLCEFLLPMYRACAEDVSNLGRRCNRIGPNDLDTTGYTHMIFTFASIDPNSCHVVPLEPSHPALYTQFTARKSPGLQTWIAIGGYSFSDPGPTQRIWSDMVSGQGSRAAFINSLITFMIQYGFQGVDLDWEFPGVASRGGHPGDTSNFVSLVQEMRSAFGSRYGISIAL